MDTHSYSLQGQIALVTGASRRMGLGAAIARELAAAGADICLTYYQPYDTTMPWGSDPAGPTQLLTELQALGRRAAGLPLNLTRPGAAATLFDFANAELGPVDILINNATHSEMGGIDTLDGDQLDRHYAMNLRAMALLCAEFARRFRPGREGRIINLTSGQGVGPMPDELAYAATKGAVDAFTVSLSAALAPRGITVNAVDPGVTDTGWLSPDLKAGLEARIPLGRVAQPQDAARLICFLASPAGGYITGQVLHVRGGF